MSGRPRFPPGAADGKRRVIFVAADASISLSPGSAIGSTLRLRLVTCISRIERFATKAPTTTQCGIGISIAEFAVL
ncbi:MAG TPA: hypothetical protein VHK70_02570 [Burkholderiaceae bacterium]|nr:hypothetical protein [Burkholderiaceae bacterium]